ncbi:hypothetical protein [Torque teno midi virus 7]|nr:hypothetical protein [Torque teno midi virus 7]BAF76084.1 hypothetical protein [Torque teno midi virus 7]
MQNISADNFFRPTHFNQVTKQQIWMQQIQDSHDNICNCNSCFAHLLANIFPPGHKDRDLSINQILARDLNQPCHSGGTEEERTGGDTNTRPENTGAADGPAEEGKHYIEDADLQELIAAGEDATGR